jgi:hypothetical protein
MMTFSLAVGAATVAWFVVAAVLFFNKPVDLIYRSEEKHPAVRALPQGPGTIGRILTAVAVQCVLWAGIYLLVEPALGVGLLRKMLVFGGIIIAVKIIPRDIDRLLLTTYPARRMTIEFAIGVVCAFVVAAAFGLLL